MQKKGADLIVSSVSDVHASHLWHKKSIFVDWNVNDKQGDVVL